MPIDPIVVRREPELVQREADRNYRGDTEKVATAGFNDINMRGVIVSKFLLGRKTKACATGPSLVLMVASGELLFRC